MHTGSRSRPDHRLTPARLCKRRRRVMHGDDPETISLSEIHRAEFRAADAGGIRKNGLKHWCKLTRQTGDESQHLRGRSLLLQCLVAFALESSYSCAQGNSIAGSRFAPHVATAFWWHALRSFS